MWPENHRWIWVVSGYTRLAFGGQKASSRQVQATPLNPPSQAPQLRKVNTKVVQAGRLCFFLASSRFLGGALANVFTREQISVFKTERQCFAHCSTNYLFNTCYLLYFFCSTFGTWRLFNYIMLTSARTKKQLGVYFFRLSHNSVLP